MKLPSSSSSSSPFHGHPSHFPSFLSRQLLKDTPRAPKCAQTKLQCPCRPLCFFRLSRLSSIFSRFKPFIWCDPLYFSVITSRCSQIRLVRVSFYLEQSHTQFDTDSFDRYLPLSCLSKLPWKLVTISLSPNCTFSFFIWQHEWAYVITVLSLLLWWWLLLQSCRKAAAQRIISRQPFPSQSQFCFFAALFCSVLPVFSNSQFFLSILLLLPLRFFAHSISVSASSRVSLKQGFSAAVSSP